MVIEREREREREKERWSTNILQMTLLGFAFIIINLLTLLWYDPTLDQDCPGQVYASWAVGLFLY